LTNDSVVVDVPGGHELTSKSDVILTFFRCNNLFVCGLRCKLLAGALIFLLDERTLSHKAAVSSLVVVRYLEVLVDEIL
jgi:hypothetical protein